MVQKGGKGRFEIAEDDQKDPDMDLLEVEEGSEDELLYNGSMEEDRLKLEPLEQIRRDQREGERIENGVPKHQKFTKNHRGKVREKSQDMSLEEKESDQAKKMSNKHELVNGGGLDLNKGVQREKGSEGKESQHIRHEDNGFEENGFEDGGLDDEDSEEEDFDGESSEFDTDEENDIRVKKGGEENDKGRENESFDESLENDDGESYDESYDEESEYSSEGELSDSSTEHQKVENRSFKHYKPKQTLIILLN